MFHKGEQKMIRWKEEYKLGVDLIDDQHKKLFEIADRIFLLLKNDYSVDKYDKLIEILLELKEYTIFHFKSEEEYMLQIGYKKFFSHKVEHAEFIEKINNVDYEKLDNNQNNYSLELLDFIVNWIDKHIMETDKLIIN